MKVWELMAELAKRTAGAEVSTCTLVTVKELEREGEIDKDEDGTSIYNAGGAVEVVSDNGALVTLIARY